MNAIKNLLSVLESKGLAETLKCLKFLNSNEREILLFSVWCSRRVIHLMKNNKEGEKVLDVAEQFANGNATLDDLENAEQIGFSLHQEADKFSYAKPATATRSDFANYYACFCCWATTMSSSRLDVPDLALSAVAFLGCSIDLDSEEKAQADELKRVLECIDKNQNPYPMEVKINEQ